MPKYYSKRNKPLIKDIPFDFWRGLGAYVDEISKEGWLSEHFGYWDGFNNEWVLDKEKINNKMLQEIGHELFPLDRLRRPKEEIIFDLIEFFFNHVSKPIDVPDFDTVLDVATGKYEYTIGINRLFNNFNLAYELKKGVIKDLHSKTIDRIVLSDSFEIPDSETQGMLNLAVEKFYSRNPEDKKIALEKLVDVYQRISSWEDKDKKKSIDKLLEKTSGGDDRIKEALGCDLNSIWKIANEFMIRHTEVGKIPITDNDFRDYLFYAYYNCIRLILIKYKYLKGASEEEGEVPF
jgi:hypothetical protein